MNTELLREDERPETPDGYPQRNYALLIQRLVEEREENARLQYRISELATMQAAFKHGAEKAESELSSARWLYNEAAGELRRTLAELAEARKDSERFKWLLRRTRFGTKESVDAAMKEQG